MRKISYTLSTVLLVLVSFVLVGCVEFFPGTDIPVPTEELLCEVTFPGDINVVESGVPVDLTVTATGGSGTYVIVGRIGTFESSTTVTRTYTNDTDEDITIEDSLFINDRLGLTEQCEFSASVLPADPDPTPTVTLITSPSSIVPTGEEITIYAFATNFENSPSFDFTYDEDGVVMIPDTSSARFVATDGEAHSFDVEVTATEGAEEASETVTLTFTLTDPNPDPIVCTISHSSGTIHPDETVTFTIAALSGEALTVTYFDAGTDGVATSAGAGGNVWVTYSTSGAKVVTAKAISATTGAECNGGAYLQDVVFVEEEEPVSTLECEASTEYRHYYEYETVWAWATATGAEGSVRITDVKAVPVAEGVYYLFPLYPMWAEVYFYETGTFQIELTVEDSATDETATCLTPSVRVW